MSIKSALQALVERQGEGVCCVAEVLAVDASLRSCDVAPLNESAEVYGVRLQAVEDSVEGLVLIPAVGSFVIVSWLSDHDTYVSLTGTVESVIGKVDKQELSWTKNGLKLNSGQADLATEVSMLLDGLSKLCDVLNQFQVATSVGPSVSVMPHIVTQVTQIKTDFIGVKTQLETILIK